MTGGGGIRVEENSFQIPRVQGDDDDKEVDDGFSDDDRNDCNYFIYSSQEDEFLQQQEVRRRLRVINDELAKSSIPSVHPSKPGQRRVTFSENLVQYSQSCDNVEETSCCTTEDEAHRGRSSSVDEELSDTEPDSSIYSDFDWTEDLLDSIPDSEEEEGEEKKGEKKPEKEISETSAKDSKAEIEKMLYKGVIDELERMRMEDIENEDGEKVESTIKENVAEDLVEEQNPQVLHPSIEVPLESNETKAESEGGEKSVLVEKDGEFKLMGENEVHAEDDPTAAAPSPSPSPSGSSEVRVEPSVKVRHSSKRSAQSQSPRPSTSSVSSKDSQTSKSEPKLPNYQGNPRSQYGISPKELKMKREKEKLELRRKQKKSEEEEEEKRQKEEEMEEAFKCWLVKKRSEKKMSIKKNKNGIFDGVLKRSGSLRKKFPEGMEKEDSEEAFRSWLKKKKEQKKRENYVERKRREEIEQTYQVHDKQSCEQAYKQWLRRKNFERKLEEIQFTAKYKRKNKDTLLNSLHRSSSIKHTIKAYFGHTI